MTRQPRAPPANRSNGSSRRIPSTRATTSSSCCSPRGRTSTPSSSSGKAKRLSTTTIATSRDPRISHHLNLEFDEYGNVLGSAVIRYPRQQPDASLPDETQRIQAKTVVFYTRNRFTNDATGDDCNRLRLPSETMTFELQGVARSGRYYGVDDFEGVLSEAATSFVEYAECDTCTEDGKARARLIEHVRHIFYDDELTGALPLHQLNSLALPFESYQLAYTPSLLADVFGTRVDEALMLEGRFTHCRRRRQLVGPFRLEAVHRQTRNRSRSEGALLFACRVCRSLRRRDEGHGMTAITSSSSRRSRTRPATRPASTSSISARFRPRG